MIILNRNDKMLEGTVIKSTGSWYKVMTENGKIWDCRIRGSFRIKGIKTTNPLAVGDHVAFEPDEDQNVGLVKKIFPRKNYILRKSTKLSKLSHIIAANIDQAVLIITLVKPRTSTGFIDRYLVTTEAYHIPAILVFNKTDLYGKKELKQLDELIEVYENAGYTCIRTSATEGENLEAFIGLLKDKNSLLSGHSGVGKSTLINAIQPGLKLKVGDISNVHQKGKHITTFAEMHPLSFGGSIIDTPGIKEFGLHDFERHEIGERFPEFRALMSDCRFSNCTHVHEPGCVVKKAVDEGKISETRYNNYLRILKDDYLDKKQWELK